MQYKLKLPNIKLPKNTVSLYPAREVLNKVYNLKKYIHFCHIHSYLNNGNILAQVLAHKKEGITLFFYKSNII